MRLADVELVDSEVRTDIGPSTFAPLLEATLLRGPSLGN
jgi:hypothetical protein